MDDINRVIADTLEQVVAEYRDAELTREKETNKRLIELAESTLSQKEMQELRAKWASRKRGRSYKVIAASAGL